MLNLSAYAADEISGVLRSECFRLHLGAFSIKVRSTVPEFVSAFSILYADYPVTLEGGAYDFDIGIFPPSPLRRWYRRNTVFQLSGETPFLPMEPGHSHAMFEWGLNWTIGAYSHNHLIIHSAVVEKNGCGVLLSATSGSGKSTLAAELAMQGWRLLSDELALLDGDQNLIPLTRPVSLKNSSIPLIQSRHPRARFGPLAPDTHKGTVGHMVPPRTSVEKINTLARPGMIIFPRWQEGASFRVTKLGSGQAALRLIDQSFNYSVLGENGFRRLAALVNAVDIFEIEYSALDDVREFLEDLVRGYGK